MHSNPLEQSDKIPFVENYKECAIYGILSKQTHFGAFPEAKKGVARAQVR